MLADYTDIFTSVFIGDMQSCFSVCCFRDCQYRIIGRYKQLRVVVVFDNTTCIIEIVTCERLLLLLMASAQTCLGVVLYSSTKTQISYLK